MADNKENENGNGNFVISKIIDLSKEISSIGIDTESQFQRLSEILNEIKKKVDCNVDQTQRHSSQIEKLYSALNQTISSLKNIKTGLSMKMKLIDQQLKQVVKKPKWKLLYTILIAIGTLIALFLSNIEKIKAILSK